MEYLFKLSEEEAMSLIEMVEQHRCEEEEEVCSTIRTSIKTQFQSQFQEHEEEVTLASVFQSRMIVVVYYIYSFKYVAHISIFYNNIFFDI